MLWLGNNKAEPSPAGRSEVLKNVESTHTMENVISFTKKEMGEVGGWEGEVETKCAPLMYIIHTVGLTAWLDLSVFMYMLWVVSDITLHYFRPCY